MVIKRNRLIDRTASVTISGDYYDELRQQALELQKIKENLRNAVEIDQGDRLQKLDIVYAWDYAITKEEEEELRKEAAEEVTFIISKQKLKELIKEHMPCREPADTDIMDEEEDFKYYKVKFKEED